MSYKKSFQSVQCFSRVTLESHLTCTAPRMVPGRSCGPPCGDIQPPAYQSPGMRSKTLSWHRGREMQGTKSIHAMLITQMDTRSHSRRLISSHPLLISGDWGEAVIIE